jgi:hypothetical protein
VDGPATTALPARPPAAAGANAGRLDRVLVRPAFDVALRVRRRDLRSRAHQCVQSARRAGAGARLANTRPACRGPGAMAVGPVDWGRRAYWTSVGCSRYAFAWASSRSTAAGSRRSSNGSTSHLTSAGKVISTVLVTRVPPSTGSQTKLA